jgi:PleD family two-component response regulator
MGIVTYTLVPKSMGEVIRNADKLMYQVKKKGKNAFKALVLYGQGRKRDRRRAKS